MTVISQAYIDKVKAIKARSLTLNEAAHCLRVLLDCASLSSGSLARLTGYQDYTTLDAIQGDFVLFVDALIPRYRWQTWREAWEAFTSRYNVRRETP